MSTQPQSDYGLAAGAATIERLRAAYSRLQDYYRWADVEYGGANNELGVEAYQRVEKTIRLVEMITERIERYVELLPRIDDFLTKVRWFDTVEGRAALTEQLRIQADIEVLTEAATLIAWRCTTAISKLPGLEGFKPQGLRNTRNHLIEHPEGSSSGVLMNSFGWGTPKGPVIKAIRLKGQEDIFPDAGLFANLDEFSADLIARLDWFLNGKSIPSQSM